MSRQNQEFHNNRNKYKIIVKGGGSFVIDSKEPFAIGDIITFKKVKFSVFEVGLSTPNIVYARRVI